MKNKVIEEEQDIGKIIDKPTPRLDKIISDIRKILSATAAKFVPDACNALREDWVPTMSDKTFGLPINKALRDRMRETILDNFSNQRGQDTPWGDVKIAQFFPDYLRNPIAVEGTKNNVLAAAAAKKAKAYQTKIDPQRSIFNKLTEQLPEPPKELEPELIYPHEGMETWPSKYQKLGESTKSPLGKMGDIRDGCRELFTALTEKDHMPGGTEDLENDYIKPTREYRKFIHELDERERIGLYNWLVITQTAIADMLNIIDEADGKKE